MQMQSGTGLRTKGLTVVLTLFMMFEVGSIVTVAQSDKQYAAGADIGLPDKADRDGNPIIFETEAIAVRRITIKPNSNGYHYRHKGGSIILLSEYSFKIFMPLSAELDANLKVGDVIQVEPGDYILENPTSKPLDFLSIEKKR